jgi:hypothetical protein
MGQPSKSTVLFALICGAHSAVPQMDGYWSTPALPDDLYTNLVDYSGNGPCYSPGVGYNSPNNTGTGGQGEFLPGVHTVLRLQCDLDPKCDAFALENPMLLSLSRRARAGATAYYSKASCGDPAFVKVKRPTIEPPVQAGPTDHAYAYCPCYGWSVLPGRSLPPAQLKQACDSDPRCSFFVALNDQSGGTLWGCTSTGGGFYLKVPPPAPPPTPAPYSCDAATGQCVESRNGTLSAEACINGCKAPTYSCNAATGQCAADPQGTQTAQGCDATCKVPMYSCNATVGKCVEDPSGTQTAQSCIGSCKCVAPHNCGQLNGTMQCGAVLAGCNVCASCCQDYFHQHSCDGCFAAPASEQGCGGNASTV